MSSSDVNHRSRPHLQDLAHPESEPSNQSEDQFPSTYEHLEDVCENLNIKSPKQILSILEKMLIYKGYGKPSYSVEKKGRRLRKVACQAGGLSYKVVGKTQKPTKQICAAGMLIVLGVTRDDLKMEKNRRGREKSVRSKLRREGREESRMNSRLVGSAIKSTIAKSAEVKARNPFELKKNPFERSESADEGTLGRCLSRSAVDQFIRDARLQSSSKGKQKLKRSIPADWEEIRRTSSIITISQPSLNTFATAVKSKSLDEKVETLQLAKAEPFPVIKAEPLPLVKSEPLEPLQFIKAEPFIKAESEEVELEDYDTMEHQQS